MIAKSHDIHIEDDVRDRAATLYANLGLDLSGAINVFLRVSINENGFPFPVKLHPTEPIEERRSRKFKEFLAFAKANPVFAKGYTFERESCYDRKVLH